MPKLSNIIARHGILEDGLMLVEKPFSPEQLAHKVRSARTVDRIHRRHPPGQLFRKFCVLFRGCIAVILLED